MLVIGEIVVEEAVVREQFSCDLPACRGACCTLEGGRGAPLLDEERAQVELHAPAVRKYLSDTHRDALTRKGGVEGYAGAWATVCVDDRACVFVSYDGPIARCAFELAWSAGEIPFRKPVSCHLFPLRYSGGPEGVLRYEEIPECGPGRLKGRREGTPLAAFVREAVARRLGAPWSEALAAVPAAAPKEG